MVIVLALAGGACSTGLGGGGSSRPNIIRFITDDQTVGTVSRDTMPNTWRWMWQGGRTYPDCSISDPLCCPSRMTIMTGRYPHNTGVIDNLSSRVSFHPDMQSVVQCYLEDAGYTVIRVEDEESCRKAAAKFHWVFGPGKDKE